MVVAKKERRAMSLKDFLEAIQDSKVHADIVVSDKGRLQPVTVIRAGAGVVMLVCRPKPQWEAERARKKEELRLSELAGQWERQEVERAMAHAAPGPRARIGDAGRNFEPKP
jgi:3-keto-L-gulonate-6-phosphate decarboxylase